MNIEARREATSSLTTLLLRDGLDRYLTEHMAAQVAGRLVGRALLVRGYLAEVEEGGRLVLQQQRANSYSDEDSILERLHELKAEQDLLNGYLRQMRSAYAVAEFDPDAREIDRESDRLREVAQDEAAEFPGIAS